MKPVMVGICILDFRPAAPQNKNRFFKIVIIQNQERVKVFRVFSTTEYEFTVIKIAA